MLSSASVLLATACFCPFMLHAREEGKSAAMLVWHRAAGMRVLMVPLNLQITQPIQRGITVCNTPKSGQLQLTTFWHAPFLLKGAGCKAWQPHS